MPFFLEPDYITKAPDFTESHDVRMIRKFGSKEAFERVKNSHGLIPRGAEVGLDERVGYTQDALTARIQSSTLKSQRLVYFVARNYSLKKSEELYEKLNFLHFTESGVLNDSALLIRACSEVGLDYEIDKIEAFLATDELTSEILTMYQRVLHYGIDSIPTIVVNGKYFVSGAAKAEEYIKIFRLIETKDKTKQNQKAPLTNDSGECSNLLFTELF